MELCVCAFVWHHVCEEVVLYKKSILHAIKMELLFSSLLSHQNKPCQEKSCTSALHNVQNKASSSPDCCCRRSSL